MLERNDPSCSNFVSIGMSLGVGYSQVVSIIPLSASMQQYAILFKIVNPECYWTSLLGNAVNLRLGLSRSQLGASQALSDRAEDLQKLKHVDISFPIKISSCLFAGNVSSAIRIFGLIFKGDVYYPQLIWSVSRTNFTDICFGGRNMAIQDPDSLQILPGMFLRDQEPASRSSLSHTKSLLAFVNKTWKQDAALQPITLVMEKDRRASLLAYEEWIG